VCGPAPRPHPVEVDAVLLAVPAPALRRLLAGVAPDAAAAAHVELASSAVVALAYRAADADEALPRASGVLVATGEPVVSKGFTFSARKWPHLAGDGVVRLRASLGRYGEARTLQVDDGELLTQARADLAALTGITAAPIAGHVQRWGGGLPQYGAGHLDRVAVLRDGVAAQPGLAVAGALLGGVGVPACIATGRAAAERIAGPLAEPGADRVGASRRAN
jgi:oxygen-dependent protoporphyrinogen oxidase